MSITNELRDYARHLHNVWYDPRGNVYTYTTMDNAPSLDAVRLDEHVLAIADRIDAEHAEALSTISRAAQLLADAEKDRDENYANWQDCKQKVLQHNITMDELSAEIGCLKDELAHRIELPKDADGVPIHIGDVMEWWHICGSCKLRHGIVTGIKTDKIGDELFHEVTVNVDGVTTALLMANQLRHYHKPSVEDLLREFVSEFNRDDTELCDEEIIERFAAKLRLAESEES